MRVEHIANSGRVTVRHAVELTPEEMAACHNLYVSLLKSNPNDCAFERAMKKVAAEWEIDQDGALFHAGGGADVAA